MNKEECIVYNFLKENNYKEIVFEPLGKSTAPDFRIKGNIALEVRLLNKNKGNKDNFEALENLNFKLYGKVKEIVENFNLQKLQDSISINFRYKRPIKTDKKLYKLIEKTLTDEIIKENFENEIFINDNLSFEILKHENSQNKKIICFGEFDEDKVINPLNERKKSIEIAIAEKTKKLKSVKTQFTQLWLVLVDDIHSVLNEQTKKDLNQFHIDKKFFNKIIIISKIIPSNWIEI